MFITGFLDIFNYFYSGVHSLVRKVVHLDQSMWMYESVMAHSLVRKVVHLFSKHSGSARSKCTGLTAAGDKGVWVWSRRLHRYTGLARPDRMKLREPQVPGIVREKGRGDLTNAQIARTRGVTARQVQVLSIARVMVPFFCPVLALPSRLAAILHTRLCSVV